MLRRAALVAMVFAVSVVPRSFAGEIGTRVEAIAMVKRVQEAFRTEGPQATFAAVTRKDPAFHDRDLYPFIYRLDGVNVAHGARPALVGKNLLNIKDPDGIALIREMIKVTTAKGSGWIDYKWPNPLNNKIEDKTSYCEKMGDYFVGVGVYRP